MEATLNRVRQIVSEHSGVKLEKLNEKSALDQDIRISGGDIVDIAEALAKEFGDDVWQWPWQRFASLDEGYSLSFLFLFPFILTWQLISWPFRGAFEYPSPHERLELGHIAAVIEKGEWFDP